MKTLVQHEDKILDRGIWQYVTVKRQGKIFDDIADAREALILAGYRQELSLSRVSCNEIFTKIEGDDFFRAVLVK